MRNPLSLPVSPADGVSVLFCEHKDPSLLGWGHAAEAWQLVRGAAAAP